MTLQVVILHTLMLNIDTSSLYKIHAIFGTYVKMD